MKTFIVILSLVLIGVSVTFFLKGCKNDAAPTAKTIDSLKWVISTDSTQYVARASLADNTIKGLIHDLDTTRHALDSIRKQFNSQGRQILAVNKRLRDAFNNRDTATVYKDCDSLSHAVDSISQVKWNVDRELDRQIVLNELLHTADSTALADCRGTLKNTQLASSALAQNYELQHQQDQKVLRKAKKGKGLWGIGGGVLGAAIRSIFK